MKCRENCGACCIALSISSPIPGMADGKPAGVRCIHLLEDYRCAIYNNGKPKAEQIRRRLCGFYILFQIDYFHLFCPLPPKGGSANY
jgi:Fe-S-cluster containining protein